MVYNVLRRLLGVSATTDSSDKRDRELGGLESRLSFLMSQPIGTMSSDKDSILGPIKTK